MVTFLLANLKLHTQVFAFSGYSNEFKKPFGLCILLTRKMYVRYTTGNGYLIYFTKSTRV